ncbi:MAG: hypothetical protein ACRDBO_16565 [Lachnospiraceae bacterium]
MAINQSAKYKKNLIYTTGKSEGLVIGERKDIEGRRALVVKNHKRIDYIYADELMQILFSPLYGETR